MKYKTPLYPDIIQKGKLWTHSTKLTWLYNYFLRQRIDSYNSTKDSISINDLQKQIPTLRKNDPILKSIYAQVLQRVPMMIYRDFVSFFQSGMGFPIFKKTADFFPIYYPQNGFKIIDNAIYTTSYGTIPFQEVDGISDNVKSILISNSDDVWYITFFTK